MPAHFRNPVGFTTDLDALPECRHLTREDRPGDALTDVRGFDVATDGDFATRADAAGQHDQTHALPLRLHAMLGEQFGEITEDFRTKIHALYPGCQSDIQLIDIMVQPVNRTVFILLSKRQCPQEQLKKVIQCQPYT